MEKEKVFPCLSATLPLESEDFQEPAPMFQSSFGSLQD